MPESTAVQRIEQALSELTPGEKARLLQTLAGQIGGIPVWLLVRARQLGASEASLLAAYPNLRAEDLVSAWAYVQLHATEIAAQIAAHEAA